MEMKKIETDINKGLRDSGMDGFIRFSIKADNTEENSRVHDGFKEFASVETDNNYTQAIRKLLEYWQSDAKTEMLWETIKDIKLELLELKKQLSEDKKEDKEEEVAF